MKNKRYSEIIGFVSVLTVLVFSSCQGQIYKNIEITKNWNSKTHFQVCEPSIAINPLNTNEVVAGSILNNYHYSKDGGKTWVNKSLTSPYGVWGDPVLMFDYTGKLYYFHLANYKKTRNKY